MSKGASGKIGVKGRRKEGVVAGSEGQIDGKRADWDRCNGGKTKKSKM